MKYLAAGALAALAIASGSAHAATNLIVNGSFETGNFSGWTLSGSPGNAAAAVLFYGSSASYPNGAYGEAVPADNSASASPDAVGSRAAYFVGDNASETLSQTLTLGVGQYTIGFSVYVPFNGFGNANDASFTGTVAGVNLASFNVDGSTPGQWRHYYGVADIQTAGDYLTQFTFNAGPFPAGDFVVDRVYVIAGAVPEPATWAMMIGGFGLAGGALRRRRALVAA